MPPTNNIPGKTKVILHGLDGEVESNAKQLLSIPFFEALILRWQAPQTAAGTSRSKTIQLKVSMDSGALAFVLCIHHHRSSSPSQLLKRLPSASSALGVIELAGLLEIKLPFICNWTSHTFHRLGRKLRVHKRAKESSLKKKTRRDSENAAAVICLSLAAMNSANIDREIQKRLYTDILYIMSHAKTSSPSIRFHVWQTFRERFSLTDNQLSQFEKWISEEKLAYDADKDSQVES